MVCIRRFRKLLLHAAADRYGMDDVEMSNLLTRDPKATRGGEFANLATRDVPRLNSLEPKVVAVLGRRLRCP